MSTQNISSAAIHVVGQYNDAGKTLVNAYRAGAYRLLGGTGFLAKRVDIETGRLVALMDRFAESATSGIESIAKAAARVEAPLTTSVINAFARVHQPIASASVKIADTVAAGAKKIERRVAGSAESGSHGAQATKSRATPAARRRTPRGSRALKA
ncbi:hypothetical protein VAR608DRAFT_6220 [Variovorax sp. HW608]|uniref:hypothetical protein n=1 Tax=Variovorax sp. HW608 TaxID=1034889 RepID=UPI00081FBF4E|nr:hypothetical protein [Variovorax sp. HW608]SCK58338.1 hypothetical protein VAR608DRAFT_6220 [Variovorax sp. HW608]